MAVSLTNTILLLWLAFTVLLNAERRTWGLWLAGSGLLLGAAFFVSHTAILGLGPGQLTWRNMIFWWTVGLVPAILLPLAWYIIMLWYAGYWMPGARLHRRQRPWFYLVTLLALFGLCSLTLGVLLLAVPAPELDGLRRFIRWSIAGVPLLAVGYSAYVMLCFGLALDALRHPEPSQRVMGKDARQRAHPWLAAASLDLLLVSLLVAGVMLWIVQDVRRRTFFEIYQQHTELIAVLDLTIAGLIGVAILLLGQAVVSYEVFTGKTLPRRGLLRHWQRAVALAVGFGAAVGVAQALRVRPIYSLLLSVILMTLFYVLMSWRSYVERDRLIASLRPFVTSQRLYERLLTAPAPPDVDFMTPFHALCRNVLGAQVAYLAALGPSAPLVETPLVYPSGHEKMLPSLAELTTRLVSPGEVNVAVDPAQYGGAIWAIPLWSERGLIGVLLLGEKVDGGLYAQEEIEIARAIGERLIDTQASAEMSRRLMMVQRERLAQTQIIDQQTRRVLHDDILPSLQAALIQLGSTPGDGQILAAVESMTQAHRQISDLLHAMPTTAVPDVSRLGLISALRKVVEQEYRAVFQEVTWQVDTAVSNRIDQIPSLVAEVIYYAAREAIRNAARYGQGDEKRPLSLNVSAHWQNGLVLTIRDNGVGMGMAPQENGSGQGLALHSTMMAVVGGFLSIDSIPKQFTQVTLTLPQQ